MFRNNLNTISHYKKVMARYENDELQVSLERRGFKYSYGDKIERRKLSDTKLGKYFNNLSVKEQRKMLKKINKE